eukprot:6230649-Pyramimonas_sp.AAC.1
MSGEWTRYYTDYKSKPRDFGTLAAEWSVMLMSLGAEDDAYKRFLVLGSPVEEVGRGSFNG